MELKSDSASLKTDFCLYEETTQPTRLHTAHLAKYIERLASLEVTACDLQITLEVKAKDVFVREGRVCAKEKLQFELWRLEEEHRLLVSLKEIPSEVLSLRSKLDAATELKRFYQEQLALLTMQNCRHRDYKDALLADEAELLANKARMNRLKTDLTLLFEEHSFILKYVAKLQTDISNSKAVTAINRLVSSRSPSRVRSRQSSCMTSPLSSPKGSVGFRQHFKFKRFSVRHERTAILKKVFVPSHMRRRRRTKADHEERA
jgi:hypothetical protein